MLKISNNLRFYSKIITGPESKLSLIYSDTLEYSGGYNPECVEVAINKGYALLYYNYRENDTLESKISFYQAQYLNKAKKSKKSKKCKKFEKVINIGLKQSNNYEKMKKSLKFYAVVD